MKAIFVLLVLLAHDFGPEGAKICRDTCQAAGLRVYVYRQRICMLRDDCDDYCECDSAHPVTRTDGGTP